jgi:hypothetical protein
VALATAFSFRVLDISSVSACYTHLQPDQEMVLKTVIKESTCLKSPGIYLRIAKGREPLQSMDNEGNRGQRIRVRE